MQSTTKKMRAGLRRKKAFTLVEVMLVVVIAAILGAAAVSALSLTFGMYEQLNDYIGGRQEIEFVAQTIGLEISNAGLGMSNNRQERGLFADSFSAADMSNPPIMAQMGAINERWGGPVTLSDTTSDYSAIPTIKAGFPDGSGRFGGVELYYAWARPTGIKAVVEGAEDESYIRQEKNIKKNGEVFDLEILTGAQGLNTLVSRGIIADNSASNAKNPLSWVLFPATRLPMLIQNVGANTLRVALAPHSSEDRQASLMGMDEIFLLQVSRIFLDGQRVMKVDFAYDNAGNLTPNVTPLAGNIAGLYFIYDPNLRMLSMYIASRGESIVQTPSVEWPDEAPDLPANRRIVVNRVDWRIRN